MTDDFDITMACLDAIEQEVRRARAALRQEALPEPCDAEVWSTDYYPAGHIDPYWIRCTKVAPHDQHQDSNTGLSWPDRPGTPAQDAHTPRTAPRTRSGGTESGAVGLSGSCARCGEPITLPMSDPQNREMAVCQACEIGLLREGYQQARAQVGRVRVLAEEWAAKAPEDDWGDDMAETFVADAGRRILAALDGASSKACGNGEAGA